MELSTFIKVTLDAAHYDVVNSGSTTFEVFCYPGKDGNIYIGGSTHRLTFTINFDFANAKG